LPQIAVPVECLREQQKYNPTVDARRRNTKNTYLREGCLVLIRDSEKKSVKEGKKKENDMDFFATEETNPTRT
jgi:hypothetical protein